MGWIRNRRKVSVSMTETGVQVEGPARLVEYFLEIWNGSVRKHEAPDDDDEPVKDPAGFAKNPE